MDNLQDLLGKYSRKEPSEIAALKQYIHDQFNSEANIGLQGEAIVITVHSAALANTLRFQLPKLKAAANTEKRIILRIG
jgi:hypothetical protein